MESPDMYILAQLSLVTSCVSFQWFINSVLLSSFVFALVVFASYLKTLCSIFDLSSFYRTLFFLLTRV